MKEVVSRHFYLMMVSDFACREQRRRNVETLRNWQMDLTMKINVGYLLILLPPKTKSAAMRTAAASTTTRTTSSSTEAI